MQRRSRPGGRKQAQSDGEDKDRHDRNPEIRGAGARKRRGARDLVEQAVRACRGKRPDDDGETERKNDRDHGELQRLRKGLERDFHGRPVAAQRVPEIESGEIDKVTAELHDKRIVEAVRLREGLTLRFGRIERQIEIGRIAGKPREEEDEHQKSDHRDQALAGASENESEHGVSFPP